MDPGKLTISNPAMIQLLKALAYLTLFCWPVSWVWGQDFELAGASFTRFPKSELKDSRAAQDLRLNEYSFFINLPKKFKNNKTVVINGLHYGALRPIAQNDSSEGFEGQNLHLLGYRLTGFHAIGKGWGVVLVLNPTLASTFNVSLESEDFIFNGALQLVKRKSEDYSYGFGIARTTRFGGPLYLPIFHLSKRWKNSQLKLLLPRKIHYAYEFDKFSMGGRMDINGAFFNANFSNSLPDGTVETIDKVAYSRVLVGPSCGYRLAKVLQLQATGGLAVGRTIELRGATSDNENFNVENGPFFQFSIAIVPPRKKSDNGDVPAS
ncbi:MAG: DUF6268 family outer membrane beta-barrel protein [Salibacteraceae bacterium]